MKILFVNPPVRIQQPPHHIPWGMGILANIAESLGWNIAFLDVNAYRITIDSIRQEVKSDNWDIIAVGGLSSQYKYIKQFLPHFKEIKPDALLIAGGGFITTLPKETMQWNPEIDIGVIGEGEETFKEILQNIENQRFKNIKGIIYREDKELIMTEPRPLIENLDTIPYPAFHLIPLEIYFQNSPLPLSPEALQAKKRIDIISERGCPRQCVFCCHLGMSSRDLSRIYDCEIKGPPVRWNSARYVVDLAKYLRFKHSVNFISFLDENFCANKKRVYEICDLWEEEELVDLVKWGCLGDAATVDYEMLQRMKDCGCTYVSYGFEAADDNILKRIKKYTTVRQTKAALDATLKAGINPVTTYMFGYPEENCQTIYQSMKFWKDNQLLVRPFFITPYPATELFNQYKGKIIKQYDGKLEDFVLELDDATNLTANLTRYSDAELLGLQQIMANQDFRRLKRFAQKKGEKIVEYFKELKKAS